LKARIAVIGGGVFGVMTAIRLAESGNQVDLYERLPGLLQGASSNANRLHKGFHYPRDEETARQCLRGFQKFQDEFGSAILQGVTNAYFIASEGSLTSPEEFLAFCSRLGLDWRPVELRHFHPEVTNVSLGVMTDELVYDPAVLRRLMSERLQRCGVSVHLASTIVDIERLGANGLKLFIDGNQKARFDAVVNCSYAEINRLTNRLGHEIQPRLYEYAAGAIVEPGFPVPASISILDGPFVTLLPFGNNGEHLLYHVKHSVISEAREPLLDPAWLDPDSSPFASLDAEQWFRTLIESCCEFIPALKDATLKRVRQGPRMVLKDSEDTDARPSIVTVHEPSYITVLSGKVDHCVWVADEIAQKMDCFRA
jgi:glycine/D-amino acid oxidase-like deaminating enzyme